MNGFSDTTYWIAIAHLPRWHTERINKLIIQVAHEKKLSWDDFFNLSKKDWQELFSLTGKELSDLEHAKTDLPRLAFIAEQLHSEGFGVIPINHPDYPVLLKQNLKTKSSPPVIYIKGKKSLLREKVVAIVGSRKAGKAALDFTDHVAKKNVQQNKVIVSGFAKGVDKQALDSALAANGKSIIVLPQGILTFQSGLKKYYQPIVNGDVLVLSTFFPKAGWEVGLAMARNAYIYGLAEEIYVAESDNKGGTWEGVMDGLKRQRPIYVRIPRQQEKNANWELIKRGAIAVDDYGFIESTEDTSPVASTLPAIQNVISEPSVQYEQRNIEKEILDLLQQGAYTTKEIIQLLQLSWDSRKLSGLLKKNPNVKTTAGKPAKYTLNDVITTSLF